MSVVSVSGHGFAGCGKRVYVTLSGRRGDQARRGGLFLIETK
jgi:hypothetical protein